MDVLVFNKTAAFYITRLVSRVKELLVSKKRPHKADTRTGGPKAERDKGIIQKKNETEFEGEQCEGGLEKMKIITEQPRCCKPV